jgi:acetyl esterase/lipase
MRKFIDIEYARAGTNRLLLDLFLPDDGGPFPLIIWIHGGAFRAGSKENNRAIRMVSRGYAVASINYRLSQVAVFPALMHDAKAAVRWLRAHAESYHLDPQRFGVWGGSAGGYLAAMVGIVQDIPELEGNLGYREISSCVQAVCDWYGPSDFLHMNDVPGTMDHDAPDSPESQLIGAPIRQHPELVARTNPITYITKEKASDLPPFLIMHGGNDRTVIPVQSQLLHDALVAVGADVTLVILGGLGHGFPGDHHRWDEIWGYVDEFFDRNLMSDGRRGQRGE